MVFSDYNKKIKRTRNRSFFIESQALVNLRLDKRSKRLHVPMHRVRRRTCHLSLTFSIVYQTLTFGIEWLLFTMSLKECRHICRTHSVTKVNIYSVNAKKSYSPEWLKSVQPLASYLSGCLMVMLILFHVTIFYEYFFFYKISR